MYTGEQSASVMPVSAIMNEQMRLARIVGELAAGFEASPVDACADMNGVDTATERATPGRSLCSEPQGEP